MRDKTKNDLKRLISEAMKPVLGRIAGNMDGINLLTEQVETLKKEVDSIRPASVDLTQEMADDIVRKIHGPLTLTKEFSDQLRQLVGSADWYQMFPFGYGGPGSGRLEFRVKADGTMHLQIQDFEGVRRWQGTFVPPDYGVTDERG